MMYNYPQKITAIALLAVMAMSINSCTDDYFNFDNLKEDPFTWTPDLAFPLVFSTLTAEDIITNVDTTNIYEIDADHFVTLIYRNVVFSKTINDLFTIPEGLFYDDAKQLDAGELSTLTSTGSVTSNYSRNHNFGLIASAGQLDFMDFHTGSTLELNLTGDFQLAGSVTVTYPDLTLNGNPLTHTFNFDNSTNIGLNLTQSIDIAGYHLLLNNTGPNNIPVNYILSLNNGPAPTSTSNQVNVHHTFINGRIAAAGGDFGQIGLDIDPDVVDIDILDNQQSGQITFVDPRLRVTMKNSFGMSIGGTINELRAIGNGGSFVDVDYTGVTGQNFTIPGATILGDTATLEWYFTGQNNVTPGANSNVDLVMNQNYQQLVYDLSASTNPPGGTPNPNWADLNSALEVTADIELPFWGTAENFTITDTIDFPIGDADQFKDNILEALLRINTLNGFPVDGQLSLHFTDSLYNITESVLNNGELLLSSGNIDGNGRVVSSTNENNDIMLDLSSIDNIFGAKYIIFDAVMNSTNNGQTPIKVYDDYELEVHLGFQVKLSASPSDLDGL